MRTRTGLLTGAVAIGAAAILMTTTATAATNFVVTAGTLGFDGAAPTLNDFSPITLDGQPQLASAVLDTFTVADATGSAAGWHVTFTSTNLADGSGTPKVIPVSTWLMSAPIVTNADGTTATGATPAGITTSAIALGSLTAGAPATIVSAATGANGVGTFLVSPKVLKMVVPTSTLVGTGTYTATATVAVVSGP
jgi:hypothetical protein